MRSFIARRLAHALLTFVGITLVVFGIVHAAPGDPVDYYASTAGAGRLSPEVMAAIRAEHRLDEPLLVQYLHWFSSALRLELGRSTVDRKPVMSRILDKLPNTLLLNVVALTLALAVAIPLGMAASLRPGSLFDRSSAAGLLLLYSVPAFWMALLLMHFVSMRWDLLPLYGMVSSEHDLLPPGARFRDRAAHFVLPVVTLAYGQIAYFSRLTRASILDVVNREFITAARARGASEPSIFFGHILRNALLPMITTLGLVLPYLFSGSVIVERLFQWDGVGRLYFDAVLSRDYPTIMGLTVITAVATLIVSAVTDIIYVAADPRLERLVGD